MSPPVRNLAGGVDSGGALTIVERLLRKVQKLPPQGGACWGSDGSFSSYVSDDGKRLANPDGPAAADRIEAQSRLLTKSLCTLQALVSNMEESGEEHVAKAMADAVNGEKHAICQWDKLHREERQIYETAAQAAITAVLGTFDQEALKTLVGEIDDVLGGGE